MTREQTTLRLAASVLLIGFGLVSALSAYAPLSGPMGAVLDAVFWPVDGGQGAAASETRLLMAIMGGITFGWGLMIWQLAGAPLARDPEVIRPILRNAVIGWFVVDSAGSFLAGAPLNVVANVPFAAMFLIPLLTAARPAVQS
ncbi:excinuclease ABC subunit A [Tabrizicola piscis]|uniref:Excinuclease ABC subunit A n=1 Tax=Tabrizicola piscis TaxID=2494374 RepID=A0A3S8U1J1_9RHOB|nr:excinuclease ABC subunit A [Tabrizicola piscis]AZL57435.1 excinuclease ABC subunit A [Tabrizicola piscis]